MHACGHDAHTAVLLGVSKVLSENKDLLKGNVKLIFQPAEEGPGGAEPMLKDGAFENPKVDAVLGLHVGNLMQGLKKGSIVVSYDSMMAYLDRFKLKLIGKVVIVHIRIRSRSIVMTGNYLTALQTIINRNFSN